MEVARSLMDYGLTSGIAVRSLSQRLTQMSGASGIAFNRAAYEAYCDRPESGADLVPAVGLVLDVVGDLMTHPAVSDRLPCEIARRAAVAKALASALSELCVGGLSERYRTDVHLSDMYHSDSDTADAVLSRAVLENFSRAPIDEVARVGGGARLLLEREGYNSTESLICILRSFGLTIVSGLDRSYSDELWQLLGVDSEAGLRYVAPEHLVHNKNAEGVRVSFSDEIRQFIYAHRGRGCPARQVIQPNTQQTVLALHFRRMTRWLLPPNTTVTQIAEPS